MLKKIISSITFTLVSFSISSAQAPSNIVAKKLSIIGSVPELGLSINNQYHFTSIVNQVGRYNVGLSNEDWSLERYHYRKTGEQTGNLTIINYDGEQARLILSFDSLTSGSVSGSYYNVSNELQWSTLDATWTLEDLDFATIPGTELPSDPSGYYAPASIADGALNAQDKYWPIYDESISFSGTDNFSASITDDSGSLSGSGTNYTYTKTGTNSASLSYMIDEAGYTFEYALQFTGKNTGIYTKYANYGSEEDITTGPFSLSGITVPEQHDWEEYDDFSSGSLDSSKWTATNSYFLGNDPTFTNERVELTGLTSHHPHDNTFLIVKDLDGIVGVEADIWLPSDAPVDTGVLIGIADAGVPVGYLDLWGDDENTRVYVNLENSTTDETIDFKRDAELGTIYRVGVIKEDDKTTLYLNGEKVAEITTWQSENIDILFRGVNNVGSPFTAYLDNVRVLRRSQDTPDPTPVTVVSDQNGNPVVVQLGEEYQWNSTLDGVTLWLVGNDSGSIMHATIKYEAGNYSGNFEFLDEVTDPVDTLSYAINENGYLAHTESLGQQYFQILSAEDGKIGTIGFMNDLSLANHSSEPADFFFTTRAAAEEYYYSKVNPKNWMWFDHYPWVYSEEEGDWLYFYPSGGTLMYWSNKGQAWRQFN